MLRTAVMIKFVGLHQVQNTQGGGGWIRIKSGPGHELLQQQKAIAASTAAFIFYRFLWKTWSDDMICALFAKNSWKWTYLNKSE